MNVLMIKIVIDSQWQWFYDRLVIDCQWQV